jgi:hypothetical protein
MQQGIGADSPIDAQLQELDEVHEEEDDRLRHDCPAERSQTEEKRDKPNPKKVVRAQDTKGMLNFLLFCFSLAKEGRKEHKTK